MSDTNNPGSQSPRRPATNPGEQPNRGGAQNPGGQNPGATVQDGPKQSVTKPAWMNSRQGTANTVRQPNAGALLNRGGQPIQQGAPILAQPQATRTGVGNAPLRPARPQLSPPELEFKARALQALGWETRWTEQATTASAITDQIKTNQSRGLRGQGMYSAGHTLELADGSDADFNRFHTKLKVVEKLEIPYRTPEVCQDLRAAAQSYLDRFSSADASWQADPGNIRRKETCESALKELAKFKLADDYAQLGDPPWNSQQSMRVTAIKAALDIASLPPGEQQAEALGHGGASPAFWINRKAPFGTLDRSGQKLAQQKTFIFKPSVESAEEGFPPHGEPAREAMTGRMADLLNASMQLSLPVPDTQVVTLDSTSLPGNVLKQLVQRQKIRKQDAYTGSVQQFADSKGQMKEQMDAAARARVPAKAAQALAVLDIVTLNTDRHGGNFVVQDGLNGEPVLVPIDHGLCFPPPEASRLSTTISTTHNALLSLPASHEPFTDEMQQSIARMDPDVQTAAMRRERAALAADHPEMAKTLSDEALENSRRAAMFLRQAAGQLSSAAVQVAIGRHHEVLFDPKLNDAAFANAAADIIAEMIPKQEGLKEFFLMPPALQAQVRSDLIDRGWIGTWSDDDNLLNDPAAAIKIWKSGQKPPKNPERDANRPQQKMTPATPKIVEDMRKVFPEMKFDGQKALLDALDAWEDWQALPDGMSALYQAMASLGAQGDGRKRARANVVVAMNYIKRAANMRADMATDTTDGVMVSIRENVAFVKSILPCCPPQAAQAAQQDVDGAEYLLQARLPPSDAAKAQMLTALTRRRNDLTDAARAWLLGKYDTLIGQAPGRADFDPDKETGTVPILKKARDLVMGGSIVEAYADIKVRDPMLAAAP